MTFVLVHSPIVGSSSWLPVANELRTRGLDAIMPSLAAVTTAPPPRWQAAVAAVRGSVDGVLSDLVLVGHSGAGLLLPTIGGTLHRQPSAYLFVDSGLPALSGRVELAPPSFKAFLRGLAVDGELPPWSKWWPPEVMDRMLPPGKLRDQFEAELPRLPLNYFDEQPEVPSEWSGIPCGYLQLSPAYAGDAAAAEERGWPVERIHGTHLDILRRPVNFADRFRALLERLGVT